MTDTTIADIVPEKVVLDNSEWFEGQDGGGSFKSRIQSIRGTGIVNLTTSAISQDIGPDAQLVLLTTSGSGLGTDQINIVYPSLDVNNFNGERIGQQIILVLASQVDPSDAINVKINGASTATVSNYMDPAHSYTNVKLDFPSAALVLVWNGYDFLLNTDLSGNGSFDATANVADYTLQGAGVAATGLAGSKVQIVGGTATDLKGGDVRILGGECDGGQGGDIVIDAKNFSATAGKVLMKNLPTADPHVADQLWKNSGVLTVSAG